MVLIRDLGDGPVPQPVRAGEPSTFWNLETGMGLVDHVLHHFPTETRAGLRQRSFSRVGKRVGAGQRGVPGGNVPVRGHFRDGEGLDAAATAAAGAGGHGGRDESKLGGLDVGRMTRGWLRQTHTSALLLSLHVGSKSDPCRQSLTPLQVRPVPLLADLARRAPLLVLHEDVSGVEGRLPAASPVIQPSLCILLSAALLLLLDSQGLQAAEDASTMARRKDSQLHQLLLREVPAVPQRFAAALLEAGGVLGEVEGEEPLADLLTGPRRLRHDALSSPLPHQGGPQKTW